jgi:hypothetical protein
MMWWCTVLRKKISRVLELFFVVYAINPLAYFDVCSSDVVSYFDKCDMSPDETWNTVTKLQDNMCFESSVIILGHMYWNLMYLLGWYFV